LYILPIYYATRILSKVENYITKNVSPGITLSLSYDQKHLFINSYSKKMVMYRLLFVGPTHLVLQLNMYLIKFDRD